MPDPGLAEDEATAIVLKLRDSVPLPFGAITTDANGQRVVNYEAIDDPLTRAIARLSLAYGVDVEPPAEEQVGEHYGQQSGQDVTYDVPLEVVGSTDEGS